MRSTVSTAPTLSSVASEFDDRVAKWRPDLDAALRGLYGDDADSVAADLVTCARADHRARRRAFHEPDRRRLGSPDWYQAPGRVGYMAYADRFGGDLTGVRKRISYLQELGVDTLHLLSLMQPCPSVLSA